MFMRCYAFFPTIKFPYIQKNFIGGLCSMFKPRSNGILSFNESKRLFLTIEIGKMRGYFLFLSLKVTVC